MGRECPGEDRTNENDRRGAAPPADSTGDGSATRVATDGGIDERVEHVHGVSVDELFELLARPGNRYTLAYVADADGPVPYEALVERVVDAGGAPAGLSTAGFRERVETRLVHSNLPKLDEAGLVDYDTSDRTVAATDATDVAIPYLELAMAQSEDEQQSV